MKTIKYVLKIILKLTALIICLITLSLAANAKDFNKKKNPNNSIKKVAEAMVENSENDKVIVIGNNSYSTIWLNNLPKDISEKSIRLETWMVNSPSYRKSDNFKKKAQEKPNNKPFKSQPTSFPLN
ncbi:MAG: hypothetical protein HQ541_18300 [Mariniphaga sp.]|nr:hypothetical protein [Mariniphaga sp.]